MVIIKLFVNKGFQNVVIAWKFSDVDRQDKIQMVFIRYNGQFLSTSTKIANYNTFYILQIEKFQLNNSIPS